MLLKRSLLEFRTKENKKAEPRSTTLFVWVKPLFVLYNTSVKKVKNYG